ncbi:thiol:disulfide interchange protein DsbA/DsbL [Dechloromonas denitrificans]|uniref:thiol:disulfide interchange protein DsbA/DsbL n=1 Tax=Azonexaceae TaxID=2008795 RepID=UPI001CF87AA8|nr:thiol:disulfide interchange protein DsbA/DsbL [Dechloromonas denitrificans]UCV03372.1 thiol:disulfide interchange protein DsbA/DsbL [Dechloromonas denitrificans]UCV07632.1 thiol:disulfide interchange protein DsbA/DsbL [Dechloromonas denitrificans]
MKFPRRSFISAILALGASLTVAMPAVAQSVGKDYTLISPVQPTDDAAKIEVLEFFSYGCPHCSDFNPLVTAWAAKLPGDVVFKKVPVTFGRGAWANIAKLYFTLEITGDLARLEADVFKAIHQDRVNLFEERTLVEWVSKRGVDAKKFTETFSSFGVMSKVKRADQQAQAFKIQGVPALAIDGKFMVGGKDFADQLAIADKLVAKARSEKSGKK